MISKLLVLGLLMSSNAIALRAQQIGAPLFFAQSFKTTAPDITGAGLQMVTYAYNEYDLNPSAYATIGLWNGLPFESTSQLLRMATGGIGGRGQSAHGWANAYWTPIAVDPLANYFLSIQAGGYGYTQVWFTNNAYADGQAYFGTFDPYSYNQYTLPFVAQPDIDMDFRTFTSAPEPSTFALLTLSLVALGVAAKRRMRNEA